MLCQLLACYVKANFMSLIRISPTFCQSAVSGKALPVSELRFHERHIGKQYVARNWRLFKNTPAF